MKSISKWRVPGFLRRLDQYLRERYPVIWYSGAHWVLFYGLLGGVLLFGAGILYPVHWVKRESVDGKYMNLDHWVVDPIRPIEFAYDDMYIYSLLLVIAFACIWMYRQFQLRPFFYQVQQSLFCLLIYVGCCWVLCGVTAAAFRMGTIVKTAWFWMPERDLMAFKGSGIYPYGFVPLAENSLGVIPEDTLSFFQKREKVFKQIWEKEESWLNQRYKANPLYWKKRLEKLGVSDLMFRSNPSYRSYLLYRSDRSDRSFISFPSLRSDLSDLSDRSYLSDLSDLPGRSYLSHLSYLSYLSYLSDRSDRSYRSDLPEVSFQLLKSVYYEVAKENTSQSIALAYQLQNYDDILSVDPLEIIPSLPNQIEDAVRSVEHARQFLREGIFWRYFWHLPYYLLLMGALLFLLPWISAKSLLQLSVMVVLFWLGLRIFEVEGWEGYKGIWKSVHLAAYLLLPLTGILLLLWMLRQQKQGVWFTTAVNMVFLGLLIVLLGALNFGRGDTLAQFGSPIDAAFYGAQLIGLLAACIVPYVQAMPKTR